MGLGKDSEIYLGNQSKRPIRPTVSKFHTRSFVFILSLLLLNVSPEFFHLFNLNLSLFFGLKHIQIQHPKQGDHQNCQNQGCDVPHHYFPILLKRPRNIHRYRRKRVVASRYACLSFRSRSLSLRCHDSSSRFFLALSCSALMMSRI